MNIEEAIESVKKGGKAIGDFFGTDIWYGIRFMLENKWQDYSDEITYERDGDIYGFEIWGTSRWEKDGYVMFVGQDDGEKDHYIFKLENRVEDLES